MSKSYSEAYDILHSFYDSATSMMGTVEITDDDIVHISDNNAAATFFATTPVAMERRTASEMGMPEAYIRVWLDAYRTSAISDEPVRFDYHHEGKGWLAVTVNRIGLIEGRQRFSYIVDDITERKRAEQALQQAHDQLEARVAERTAVLELAKADLEAANQQLQRDAFYDPLTGLPNRLLFTNRLQHAIERYQRDPDLGFTVLFMDLDHFKVINDSLGHTTGDALLVAVGQRLQGCLREADTVARLGGDEFTMLLEHCDAARAAEVVTRLREALAQPFELQARTFTISGSVGVVFSEAGHLHPQDLLRDADLAMYRAKLHRAGRHEIFDETMREGAIRRLQLEVDLRRALTRRSLSVYFQPIVCLDNFRLSGFEALVRWHHPEHGLLTPDVFLPLAEETGLVIELDRQVLNQACRQFGVWQSRFPKLDWLKLNINLSSWQFVNPNLAEETSRVLKGSGLGAESLNLEITEGLLVQPVESVDAAVEQLTALGLGLCIDDFGAGYASLSYLQRFPVRTLKINRGFVQRLQGDDKAASLVQAIVTMTKTLGLRVVAEGVETDDQLAQLRELGCGYGQGYLFAKPLDEVEATAFIAAAGERGGLCLLER